MVPDFKLPSLVYQFSAVNIYLTYINNGLFIYTGKHTTMFIKCSWLVFDFAYDYDKLKGNDVYKFVLFKNTT